MATASLNNRFAYQARDAAGQTVNGVVAALTLAEATRVLRAEGKFIVDIKPAGAAESAASGNTPMPVSSGSVKREELINFTIQLSVMVDTGVPLSDALTALAEQALTPASATVFRSILADVQGGKDFSAALERFPRTFPRYYISLVRASEMSGSMGPILRRLAEYLVSQRDIVKKVRGAMIYPSFMLIMAISTTLFLLTVVLPKFTAIFAARKAALPLPTQLLIAVSDSLLNYWYAWASGTFVAIAFLIWFVRTPRGKIAVDFLKLHTPVFGPMFHKLCLSRSLSTMGAMIASGVQVLDCLTIARDVSGNYYYARLWDDVRDKIQSGQQFCDPLLKSRLIPKSVAHMLLSGEKTGELPAVMNRVAGYLEEDLRTAIKTATQFIEPVMIGLMGLLIGGVAVAMLLPIMTISKVMGGH